VNQGSAVTTLVHFCIDLNSIPRLHLNVQHLSLRWAPLFPPLFL
jgi:hypothetical protein